MSNLSGRGQLTGIMRNGSGGGGGSEVIINPSGAAIGTMEKISVDGDIYEVRNVPGVTSASNGDVLTISDSGFGWHPPTKELPVFTSSDNNKVLTINNDTLTWETIPKELPTITSSDEGKVLGVSNGTPVWTSSGGGGGTIYSTDEQEIGTWIDGSKLYQKTYIFQEKIITNSGSGTVIDIDVSGIDKIIYSFVGSSNYSQSSSVCSFIDSGNFHVASVIEMYANIITIQYTKVGE